MDLIKIGKFIAKKRKEINLTQNELAKRLFVTDRAISKWECGKSFPDSSILLKLCEVLNINVNELLLGEEIEMDKYNKVAENTLLEIVKQKEESDKRLLNMEIALGLLGALSFLGFIIPAILGFSYWNLPLWAFILMLVFGGTIFTATILIALRIEQKAGYYECKNCHDRHKPTYFQVFFAPHINRSRYMKCAKCGKRTYQKKVISKNE